MSASEDMVQRMLVNPFYAMNVAEGLCTPHPPLNTLLALLETRG